MIENNDVVMIRLDRPYELRFGNKALKEYSALTETTMKDIEESIMKPGNQQAAAYLMIRQDCRRNGYPPLTPEQVEDLLDEYVSPAKLFYLVNKALEAAFTDEEVNAAIAAKQADGAVPQTAAGTGAKA